ncbi:MAG: hypothetical protein KC656_12265 [Myxococcales bacterium]|nr:hypothetical protein [Myxococcales bacterium]
MDTLHRVARAAAAVALLAALLLVAVSTAQLVAMAPSVGRFRGLDRGALLDVTSVALPAVLASGFALLHLLRPRLSFVLLWLGALVVALVAFAVMARVHVPWLAAPYGGCIAGTATGAAVVDVVCEERGCDVLFEGGRMARMESFYVASTPYAGPFREPRIAWERDVRALLGERCALTPTVLLCPDTPPIPAGDDANVAPYGDSCGLSGGTVACGRWGTVEPRPELEGASAITRYRGHPLALVGGHIQIQPEHRERFYGTLPDRTSDLQVLAAIEADDVVASWEQLCVHEVGGGWRCLDGTIDDPCEVEPTEPRCAGRRPALHADRLQGDALDLGDFRVPLVRPPADAPPDWKGPEGRLCIIGSP